MKKILIATLEYPPAIGGIASYVANFAAHVAPEKVVLYTPTMKGDKEFDEKNKWRVYRRDPFLFLIWPRWLASVWQLWSIVRKEKIDVVHIHHALPLGYAAYILKIFLKIPYVIFLHGTDLALALRPLKRAKFRFLLARAERVCVGSNFMKSKLESRVDKLPPITVLYACPADSFFEPVAQDVLHTLKSQLGLEGKKVVLTVGRMVDGKGHPHLIRLWPYIVSQVPNAVLVMIGSGPKFKQIEALIQTNRLQGVVRLLGAIPYADLAVYYQMADVFTLLTHPDEIAEEGWGTVFLEAAASSLPVVAGRAGGVEEAVAHGVSGMIVDTYQELQSAETIIDLLKRPDYAHGLGLAGRELAQREFRWSEQIKKLEL